MKCFIESEDKEEQVQVQPTADKPKVQKTAVKRPRESKPSTESKPPPPRTPSPVVPDPLVVLTIAEVDEKTFGKKFALFLQYAHVYVHHVFFLFVIITGKDLLFVVSLMKSGC